MNERHPDSARHPTMSCFSSSKGNGLDEELCPLVSPPQPCASSLYEQVENLALVDDAWIVMAMAPLRWKRANPSVLAAMMINQAASEAGYGSAVVTLEPQPANPVAIRRVSICPDMTKPLAGRKRAVRITSGGTPRSDCLRAFR
jgi:hypothetical protein